MAGRDLKGPQVRIEARLTRKALGIKSVFLVPEGLGEEQEVTVEQLALLHYATPLGGGWTGGDCGLLAGPMLCMLHARGSTHLSARCSSQVHDCEKRGA